jgi:hypothetical protein
MMKRYGFVLVALLMAAPVSAQSWTAPRTWSTGETVTASLMNTHVRDNELVLRAGGISVSSQAIGDVLCASSTTQFARLADVATGSVLVSGGVGVCPSYSSAPTLSAAVTGAQAFTVRNTAAGTTNNTSIRAGNDLSATLMNMEAYSSTFTSGTYAVANGGAVFSTGAGGLSVMASDAAGVIRFIAGGTAVRWGINAAGDHTFGASSHIADSAGTPTISSGGGTSPSIAGQDYAFKLTFGVSTVTAAVIAFGHTWTTAPVCVATGNLPGNAPIAYAAAEASTTQVTVRLSDYSLAQSVVINVVCRSY